MPRDEQWKRNHAALSDGERSELEMAQAKTVQLAAVMMACCRDLDNGRRPGPDPETDTFWVDNVFVEALEHQKGTGSLNRIVWHPDAQEFTRMQRDRLVFELFSTADPNWYAFGMYSVLPTWLWEKFLKTVVTFFRANPDYVASDGEMLDSEIVAQAIALYDSTHHRRLRTAHTHENCTPEELEQAQAIRVAGEVKRAAERFEQERVAMLKSLLNPAQSDSDGRGKPR